MTPLVLFLGRPNVGKSTLFNRLIRSNRAITHDRPGITRDRMEGVVHSRTGRTFRIMDTGGITLDNHQRVSEGPEGIRGFEQHILLQAEAAIKEATVLCLVVDAREGLTPFDEHLATKLRKSGKPVMLVVNKVDGLEKEEQLLAEFHILGFPSIAVSAAHGHNVRALEEDVQALFPLAEDGEGDQAEVPLKLCLLGKPNAGKSSLVNHFAAEDRMIVSDVAGTTRDSVDVPIVVNGRKYIFVDTAGVRRRAKISDIVERFSVNSSLKSTTKAHVTLLMLDALEGLTQQDKRLIDLLDERKTPFMVLLNKIDLIPKKERAPLLKEFSEALQFCKHVPLFLVSALTGDGIRDILPTASRIFAECSTRVGTGKLNRAMEEVLAKHQPPVVRRVRPKFYYLTQAEINPPTFVLFVNDADRVSESYVRYLEKSLRNLFNIEHAPMRLNLRSSHTKKSEKNKKVKEIKVEAAAEQVQEKVSPKKPELKKSADAAKSSKEKKSPAEKPSRSGGKAKARTKPGNNPKPGHKPRQKSVKK